MTAESDRPSLDPTGITVVAAGWTAETQNQTLNIPCATTCAGQSEEKAKLAEHRREFMKTKYY